MTTLSNGIPHDFRILDHSLLRLFYHRRLPRPPTSGRRRRHVVFTNIVLRRRLAKVIQRRASLLGFRGLLRTKDRATGIPNGVRTNNLAMLFRFFICLVDATMRTLQLSRGYGRSRYGTRSLRGTLSNTYARHVRGKRGTTTAGRHFRQLRVMRVPRQLVQQSRHSGRGYDGHQSHSRLSVPKSRHDTTRLTQRPTLPRLHRSRRNRGTYTCDGTSSTPTSRLRQTFKMLHRVRRVIYY